MDITGRLFKGRSSRRGRHGILPETRLADCPKNGGFAWEVSLFLALGGSGFWELFWSRFWIDFEVDFGVVLEPFLEPILVSFWYRFCMVFGSILDSF